MPEKPIRPVRLPVWFLIQILLIASLVVAALTALVDATTVASGFTDGWGIQLGIDRLSAVFLLLICMLGLASALAGLPGRRRSGWLGLIFIAAMALLVVARDALTFLAAWELMSLAPAAAILAENQERKARQAVLLYIGTTHICGAGAWLGMLYMADHGVFSGGGGAVPAGIAVLTMIGFAAKAGLVPLHFWLPRAHPLAPAPISALMSGVMISLALYAMIRLLFDWLAPAPAWLGWGLLVVGLISALLGAYSAAMSGEMKRLLAFSSIENMGLAAVAIGLAGVLAAGAHQEAAPVVLGIALFQLLAHGVAKSALFLAGGVLTERLGSLELDHLGGLSRRMPQTSVAVVLAAFSLAAIPPLAGFAAEWALLQSLISAGDELGGGGGLVLAAGAGTVGLVAGLVLVAFCKLIGLSLLGLPRRQACEDASEPGFLLRLPLFLGAGGALLAGLGAGVILPWLETGTTAPLLGAAPLTEGGLDLGLPGSGSLPQIGIAAALLLAGGVIWRLRGPERSSAADTWICGQPQAPRLAWTGAGFVKTLRMSTTRRPVLERQARGSGPALEVEHTGEARHPFEWRLHRPLFAGAMSAAALARRLQSGRLRTYLLYLALTMVVALAVARLELLW